MIIREIEEIDFPHIMKIEVSNYDSPEELCVLKEKWLNNPSYCFVAEDVEICGFIIAYPACTEHVAKLHSKKTEIMSNDIKSLYVHDIAVLDKFKGIGIGSQLYNHACMVAKERGLTKSNLVAVNKIASIFWEKYDYFPTDTIASKYGYEDEATVMCRNL